MRRASAWRRGSPRRSDFRLKRMERTNGSPRHRRGTYNPHHSSKLPHPTAARHRAGSACTNGSPSFSSLLWLLRWFLLMVLPIFRVCVVIPLPSFNRSLDKDFWRATRGPRETEEGRLTSCEITFIIFSLPTLWPLSYRSSASDHVREPLFLIRSSRNISDYFDRTMQSDF